MILASLIAIMSIIVKSFSEKRILMTFNICWRSSKFLLREHAFIWNRDNDLLFGGMLCISTMSQYLDEQTFSGSLVFSGVALLNWFTKSFRFEEGFNNNELLWSLSRYIHSVELLSVFVQQARKFLLLDMELKGKIVLQQSMQYQDSLLFLKIPVI